MNDICMEYMVKKKPDIRDKAFITAIIAAGVVLTFILLVLLYAAALALASQHVSGFAFSIGLVLIALMWYGAFLLISTRSVEYEYTLINSEIDVDKIMSKRGRKRIVSLDFADAEIVACTEDSEHNHKYLSESRKPKIYNAVGDKNKGYVYFADFRLEEGEARLLFQPTAKMMEAVKRFNPGNVFIMK